MSSRKPAILLAEDNKANQIISKAMIEATGASVEIAENGVEVLQHLQEKSFYLVLLDCQMPVMDGFEAVEKIRALEDQALATIPVVALTADAQSDTRDACLEKGMNDFLTKPFTIDQIALMISKWTAEK